MKYQIVGRHLDVTEAMKTIVQAKLSRLEKYFLIHDLTECRVVISANKELQTIEVTIPTNVATLRAQVRHGDFYAAVDLVVDKLDHQIRRVKTRVAYHNHTHLGKVIAFDKVPSLVPPKTANDIVRTKQVIAEELDLDEAINRMELLGHDFFIYYDTDDKKIAIAYRRDQGGYGLIEVDK